MLAFLITKVSLASTYELSAFFRAPNDIHVVPFDDLPLSDKGRTDLENSAKFHQIELLTNINHFSNLKGKNPAYSLALSPQLTRRCPTTLLHRSILKIRVSVLFTDLLWAKGNFNLENLQCASRRLQARIHLAPILGPTFHLRQFLNSPTPENLLADQARNGSFAD